MIGTLGDVPHTEPEEGRELRPVVPRVPVRRRARRDRSVLPEVERVDRLVGVASLAHDAEGRVARSQHVHQVDRSDRSMPVGQHERPVADSARRFDRVVDADLGESFAHLRRRREAPRDEPGPDDATVDRDRLVVQHAFGVFALLRRREDAVGVPVDIGEDRRCGRGAGDQTQRGGDAVGFDRDDRRLQVFVDAVRPRVDRKRQERGGGDDGGDRAATLHRSGGGRP